MIRRLQNQIAESRWALPLTAIYGAAIVVLLGAVEQQMWAQTALLALSTLLMAVRLQAFSLRTFCASLLGLITPYWLVAGYFLYQADYTTPLNHFTELTQFALPATIDISQHLHPLVTFAFIVVLTFTGIIHFLRQRSKDKLRTQIIYELFLIVTLFTIVFFVLQPQHNDFLLRILIIHASIFIGHFIALTRTKITNIAFIVIFILTLAITAFHFIFSSKFDGFSH